MQITQENLDTLNAIVKLQVKKEDYEPKINETLKTYRQKVDVKGFRKGHAPLSMVKKMYGNNVLAETVNDLLNEKINGYIVDNEIDILGHPLPKEGQTFDMDIDHINDFDFEYELGLAPSFSLDVLAKKPTLQREVINVTDKMLDEEVERLTKRYGKVETVVDTMQDDDMLTFQFDEIDENNAVVENGISYTTPIALDMLKAADTQKAVKKTTKR
ncbi:MAG: trigger factor family protein [Chitinophagales bacterium]|nr:trigger factor family protein [Chitinophagales bacterium]